MTREIHLLGHLYTTRHTMAGTEVVLVKRGKWLWRVASAEMTERVLKGLHAPMLRIVK